MCSMKMMLLGELNPSVHARVIGYKAAWETPENQTSGSGFRVSQKGFRVQGSGLKAYF